MIGNSTHPTGTSAQDLLDAALTYAARGWHVFPCHTPTPAGGCSCRKQGCEDIGKHPRTRNGLDDATTDEATIRRWWKQFPQANIAIRTGAVSSLVVLDEDSYKGGDSSREDLERSYSSLPETVQQLTGGGGVHYLFAHLGMHIKNSVSTLGPGLDIRGDGGYIIAPPSLHASGKRYAWELSHLPEEFPLAPFPDWLTALCQDTTRRETVDAGAPIPKGQRNQILFQCGCALRARGFSAAAILGALQAMNATQCQPPLTAGEVETIVASCATYPPGTMKDDAHQDRTEPSQPRQEPLSFVPALLSFQGLLTLDIPERKRYVEWLPERGIGMVYGPRGAGKTMLMLGLTLALTTGTTFLKWPVHHQTGVLYIDGEMPLVELRERTVLLAHDGIPQDLHFLTGEMVYEKLGVDFILTSTAARTAVEEILDAHPTIRVLILDNISCLFSGMSEDKKQDWEPINNWLVRLRHRGMTVVLVHHAGKGGQQRGTSGREDSLDTVVSLEYPQDYRPEEGCHFALRFTKSRSLKGEAVAALDVRLEDMPDGPTWTYRPLEESGRQRVEQMLNDDMSPGEIATELDVSRSYVYRIKRDMAKMQETQHRSASEPGVHP